jgi:hypothetical protein
MGKVSQISYERGTFILFQLLLFLLLHRCKSRIQNESIQTSIRVLLLLCFGRKKEKR